MKTRVGNTIAMLRRCQALRAAGRPVYLKSDPAWLLDMAINRRAGWVEDPHAFGSVQPVALRGRGAPSLPRFATGDAQWHIRRIAHAVNTRAVVRPRELAEWRRYLMTRMPERFCVDD